MFEPVAPAAYGWGGGSHTLSETVTLMTLSSRYELDSLGQNNYRTRVRSLFTLVTNSLTD